MADRCGRWSSRRSGRRSRWSSSPIRSRDRDRSPSACARAESAGPTCTSRTASCASPNCPWCWVTKSSASPTTAAASAFPGSAGPAASARIAGPGAKTFVIARALPVYHVDGGYAEMAIADERYCFPLPDRYSDVEAAPLLCAGLIGHRCLRMAGDARRLGIYGFGAAAHLVAQVAKHEGRAIYAFTSPSDVEAQRFALELGAVWAGSSLQKPPDELDAAIIFAPVGALVPLALKALAKGGTVVCGGIHMSDVPSFPYELLWGERVVRSVAHLTRRDGEEFLALAPQVPVRTEIETFALTDANEALDRLRRGELRGSAVLQIA